MNYSVTENGMPGYSTTNHALLDLNFAVSSLRYASDKDIVSRFTKAYKEDPTNTIVWLFYARDVRGGMGERRLFRLCLAALCELRPEIINDIIPFVAMYGRYDDLWCLLNTKFSEAVENYVRKVWAEDVTNMRNGKPISLLAKWMPSCNTSSVHTRAYARMFIKAFGINERTYRKGLATMRKYIDVTECKMSAQEWDKIKYEAVPSRANLFYNSAFLKHDESRRRQFLESVIKGEAKVHADVLFPHDVVHKYASNYYTRYGSKVDDSIEAMWRALPNFGLSDTLVVADGSGSMGTRVSRESSVTCHEVADALAIYFSERASGIFKDKYVTFSDRPQLVDLSKFTTLQGKLYEAVRHNECASTNIEAVFDLLLNTALHHDHAAIPKNILILSDMEFNEGTFNASANVFKYMQNKYQRSGYELPRLVFWNIASRTGTIPLTQNEQGVVLVSGFFPNVCKMIMSGKTDPYECLLETLNSERYAPIRKIL